MTTLHPLIRRVRAAYAAAGIRDAWVRHYTDGVVWAGSKHHGKRCTDDVQAALENAGFRCERNGNPGTCGEHIIDVLTEAPTFAAGARVVFAPALIEAPGGRRWGGAAPPPVGILLTIEECRLRQDKPFWYGVVNDAGTRWRVWANQVKGAPRR